MIEIEIIREYKQCWRVGQRRAVANEFALMLIEQGFAKRTEQEVLRAETGQRKEA